MALKMTRLGLKSLVTDAVSAAAANVDGVLSAVWFALFQAWPGWDPDLTLGDLTLANFDVYHAKEATFSAAYYGGDGWPSSVSNQETWTPSNGDQPNSIIGVALLSGNDTGDLYGIDVFPAPVSMLNEDSRLTYALEFGVDPGADYGQGTVIS